MTKKRNICVGDLVKLTSHTNQNGMIYRVIKQLDVVKRWDRARARYVDVPAYHLMPVLVLINAAPDAARHNIRQTANNLARIDLLELGKTYAQLGTLIQEEVARLSGEENDTRTKDT